MKKQTLAFLLTLMFLVLLTCPPISSLFHIGGAVKLAIYVFGMLVLYPTLILKKTMAAILLYGLTTFIFYVLGNGFFNKIEIVIVPILGMMGGMLICEYAFTYDAKGNFTKMVVITAVVSNVIMALITIPQLHIHHNLIRNYKDIISDEVAYGLIPTYWVTSYSTLHGITCLFAPMVFLCRKFLNNKKMKQFYFWSGAIVVLLLLLFQANAAIPLIMTIILTGAGLLFHFEHFTSDNIKKVYFVGILALILLNPTVLVALIDLIQRMLPMGGASYVRFEEMKDVIIYGEADGDLKTRMEHYRQSVALFCDSPLWGTSQPELISHHTWILDRLACFGLLFFFPLVHLFATHIRRVYKSLDHTKVTYFFGVSGYLLMLLLKNDFGIGTWLYAFGILPVICRYIDMTIDKQLSE